MSLEAWGDELPDEGVFDAAIDAGWINPDDMSKASLDVLAERERQVDVEGWTVGYDDTHRHGELAYAAASYTLEAASEAAMGTGDCPVPGWAPECWPFDRKWWKPGDQRRNLVKSAALILAEIERLDRAEAAAA